MLSGRTIAATMAAHNNRSRGFDYLRLGLSLAVVFWHSFFLLYGLSAMNSPARTLVVLILPMFFALSGFLVSGSLSRISTIAEFLTLRAVRILPALAVEVTLSAIIIGAVFTTLPLGQYYTSGGFGAYFLNILGDIHFQLPGVFKTNPTGLVNSSLWTIPYELECYLALTLLWLVGAIRRRTLLVALVIVFQLAVPLRDVMSGNYLHLDESLPGRVLVLGFLFGVILFQFRERVILSRWLFLAAAVATVVLLHWTVTSYFVALPAAYMTAYVGLTNPPKIPVIMDGDYSYGIYLYAAPIQQAVIALFPAHRVWWFVFAVAILPVALFAAFSWHLIEEPILKRRKLFVHAVERVVGPIAVQARRARSLWPARWSPSR